MRPPKNKQRDKHAFEIAEVLGNSEVVAFLGRLSRGRRYIEQFLQYDIQIQHPLLTGSSLRTFRSQVIEVLMLGLWNHLSCEAPKMFQWPALGDYSSDDTLLQVSRRRGVTVERKSGHHHVLPWTFSSHRKKKTLCPMFSGGLRKVQACKAELYITM